MKISKLSIMTFCLYFAVFSHFYYIKNYNIIADFFLSVVVIYLLCNINVFFASKNRNMNIAISSFVGITFFFSLINYENTKPHINTLIVFCVSALVVIFFIEKVADANKMESFIQEVLLLHTSAVLINDIILLSRPGLEIEMDYYYLIGNKFDISYAHFLWISLYFSSLFFEGKKAKRHQIIVGLIIVAFTCYIVNYVGCVSAVVGSIFMTGCILLMIFGRVLFSNEKASCLFLFGSTVFTVANGFVLNISFVRTFIKDVLGHGLTLSGRIFTYQKALNILSDHWLIGLGYGTTYSLGMRLGGFPNTQNALLEWIWQCGIIGTALLILSIHFALVGKNSSETVYPFIILINLLLILASVEITINMLFIVVVAIVYGLKTERKFVHNNTMGEYKHNGKINIQKCNV